MTHRKDTFSIFMLWVYIIAKILLGLTIIGAVIYFGVANV